MTNINNKELEKYLIKRKLDKDYLFIPYLAYSYPELELCSDIIDIFIEEGADTIELGLPFTDPIADGPILQKVFKKVLEKPFHKKDLYKFIEKVNANHPNYPLLLMGYANMFLQENEKDFFNKLYDRNVRGVIVPDMPYHEKLRLQKSNKDIFEQTQKIPWIDFITPTSKEERIKEIAKNAAGFLYVVSTKGVTGQNEFSLSRLKSLFYRLREETEIPLMVGFGVKTRAHVEEALKYADGFIIGSKIHEIIDENIHHLGKIPVKIRQYIRELKP